MAIDRQRRATALIVAACFFMENLDGTIVTTAATAIGDSLGVTPAAIGLVITSYLVTLAVFVPASGWLARRFGGRRIFLIAIALFTIASLGCALSTGLEMLVVMRIIQGIGGALMVPVGRTIVVLKADKKDLISLVAYITWPALIAPVIAPLLGAIITSVASWHWLFLINIPLGLIAFVVAWRVFPATPERTAGRFDVTGLVLLGAGLGVLVAAAHLISEGLDHWQLTLMLGAAALVILGLASWHLVRASAPLVNLRTLHIRSLRFTQLSMVPYMLVVGSAPFLLPLMGLQLFGWSAIQAGTVTLMIFVGNIAIKPLTTPLLHRVGFRPVLVWSNLGLVLSTAGFAATVGGTSPVVVSIIAVLAGAFRSLGFTAYNTLALADVPEETMVDANTLAATVQQLGAGLAIAAGSLALGVGGALSADSLAGSFAIAWGLMAAVALVPFVRSLLLDPGAGSAVRR
ncbi:MAG: MFS transporter [Mycetocola sp.]